MSKLIIIVYEYAEKYSKNTNAICLYNIVNTLSSYFKIEIITSTITGKFFVKETAEYKIHYIPIDKNLNSKKQLIAWSNKSLNYISSNIDELSISKLLTISFPFENHIIGYKLKRKYTNLEWFIYDLDPYTYNKILSKYWLIFPIRLFKELLVYFFASKILLTYELYDQYNRNIFKIFRSKFKRIGIPMMKIYTNDNFVTNNLILPKKKLALYIGSFYSKVRNPFYMIDLFKKITFIDKSIELLIVGSSEAFFSKNIDIQRRKNIKFIGRVSKSKVTQFINKSDFLINIGNKSTNQLPSKILEYIGTGKPIINFYSVENDLCNLYLSNYPNSLLINQKNDSFYNLVLINHFINNNINKRLSFDLLIKNYGNYTISSIALKIIESFLD